MRQTTFFPVFKATIKNCVRCLENFDDFSVYGRAHVCEKCKAGTRRRPTYNEWKNQFGKPLSVRETQIAALIVEGKPNKVIAWECKLAQGTVKVYTTHIYAKAGVKGRIEFVMWWLKKHERLVA